jgi:hypothetical protein
MHEDGKYGVSILIQDEIPNGYKTHVIGHVDPTKVEFDNYYLTEDVFEATAKDGGMKGSFEWRPLSIPQAGPEADAVLTGLRRSRPLGRVFRASALQHLRRGQVITVARLQLPGRVSLESYSRWSLLARSRLASRVEVPRPGHSIG